VGAEPVRKNKNKQQIEQKIKKIIAYETETLAVGSMQHCAGGWCSPSCTYFIGAAHQYLRLLLDQTRRA